VTATLTAGERRRDGICEGCGADAMGCTVKRGLGGRDCCDHCTHDKETTTQ
jgi:hypothetical protein